MWMFIMKSVGASLLGAYTETKYGPALGTGTLGLPALFGATPLLLTSLSFWALVHGFIIVAQSRPKYIKLAKDAGEKEVDERYGLPNLYAQGTSKYVKTFNCIQRSHQHVFETFTAVCVTSVVAAVHYPICAALTTLAYGVGRVSLSNAYANAEGDPSKRYSGRFAPLMWFGILTNIVLSTISSVSFVAGKPIL